MRLLYADSARDRINKPFSNLFDKILWLISSRTRRAKDSRRCWKTSLFFPTAAAPWHSLSAAPWHSRLPLCVLAARRTRRSGTCWRLSSAANNSASAVVALPYLVRLAMSVSCRPFGSPPPSPVLGRAPGSSLLALFCPLGLPPVLLPALRHFGFPPTLPLVLLPLAVLAAKPTFACARARLCFRVPFLRQTPTAR